MTDLLSTKFKFCWMTQAQKAFDEVQAQFIRCHIVMHIDPQNYRCKPNRGRGNAVPVGRTMTAPDEPSRNITVTRGCVLQYQYVQTCQLPKKKKSRRHDGMERQSVTNLFSRWTKANAVSNTCISVHKKNVETAMQENEYQTSHNTSISPQSQPHREAKSGPQSTVQVEDRRRLRAVQYALSQRPGWYAPKSDHSNGGNTHCLHTRERVTPAGQTKKWEPALTTETELQIQREKCIKDACR
ncbi:hypothetical protein PR048_011518 [Dryococelus australis]|uniref:Uncharacterized protein n=1 Tax=Dryococelus australis TaxID=614101 RepID=A0ABQ9HMJ8_9NEOP|nr:hypothetical protein PR048_011518 [Dryococelus australis]